MRATISAPAGEACASRPIIYHQFGGKETLSAAIIAERYETLLPPDQVWRPASPNPHVLAGPVGGPSGRSLFKDRPEVTFLKDWSEVSAPVQVLAALAQVPQVAVPAEQPQVVVPAARLQALGPEQAQALAPEEASEQASALVLGPGPELQPSVALVLARGPRPCAHT